jgi:hypothetical protein
MEIGAADVRSDEVVGPHRELLLDKLHEASART